MLEQKAVARQGNAGSRASAIAERKKRRAKGGALALPDVATQGEKAREGERQAGTGLDCPQRENLCR